MPDTSPPRAATPCDRGDRPLTGEGNVGRVENPDSDAASISTIRWQEFPLCERFTVELASAEGAPAVRPPTVAGTLAPGLLRVSFGAPIVASPIADQRVETDLVDRLFVVRDLDGTLFVDLHLTADVVARVDVESAPARVVIDLAPTGQPVGAETIVTSDLVVTEPTGGDVRYPLTVFGYVRDDDQDLVGTIRITDGETVSANGVTAPHGDVWGAYVLLFPDGPTGAGVLELGDVRIPLNLR